ncbi:hypothetical protein PseudUWO311_15995 [Pseudanabaena sp. UWO311]|uniref:hypothetical protein n=1 Tax=Pseudanabaena sp. UWO311 TaxID=2487337 RepID=UPI0011576B1D|nr:hypothetical protein [Pseudanabaena sp. UWO311]TYQ25309.1 hypothetical protein PseudUWO311_15995 [Pseudanabaena sp. UWO311]
MTNKYSTDEFKIDQIVCIDFPRDRRREKLHLFAEVIDNIPISSRCWARPLAIARSNPESFELEFLHDLRDAAQLILPTHLFRYALDTEVIPLLSELYNPTQELKRSENAQSILYQFISDLYQLRELDQRKIN